MLEKVDEMIIVGGMAFTFFKAQGKEIGKSLLEAEKLDLAKELLEKVQAPVSCSFGRPPIIQYCVGDF